MPKQTPTDEARVWGLTRPVSGRQPIAMCKSLTDGNKVYQTPRQLERLVGSDNIVWFADPSKRGGRSPWREMDTCLCDVDILASLRRVGLLCEQHSPDPMDLRLVRP